MRYFTEKPELTVKVFGQPMPLDHPYYKGGTLYLENGKGLIVSQKKFNPDTRECRWDSLDLWLANAIYLAPKFRDFFVNNAKDEDYPIFEFRNVMWLLGMKPLKREEWEGYF